MNTLYLSKLKKILHGVIISGLVREDWQQKGTNRVIDGQMERLVKLCFLEINF